MRINETYAIAMAEVHDRFFCYCESRKDTCPSSFKLEEATDRFFEQNKNLCIKLGITRSNLMDLYLMRMT